ncbi:MAG: hypothetical protein ACO395_10340, partial [Pontimonas sp.]
GVGELVDRAMILDLRAFLTRVVPRGPIEADRLASIMHRLEGYGTRTGITGHTGTETESSMQDRLTA